MKNTTKASFVNSALKGIHQLNERLTVVAAKSRNVTWILSPLRSGFDGLNRWRDTNIAKKSWYYSFILPLCWEIKNAPSDESSDHTFLGAIENRAAQ